VDCKNLGQLFLKELENVLDMLWLSQEYKKVPNQKEIKEPNSNKPEKPQKSKQTEDKKQNIKTDGTPQKVEVYTKQQIFKKTTTLPVDYITLPRQQTLQNYRNWEKAFKPLKITNQNIQEKVINEEKTVNLIAQTDIYQVISEYKEKPVFSLLLIIDKHHSMEIFENLIDEFCNAIAHFGIFERVEITYLDSSKSKSGFYRDKKLRQKVSKKQFLLNKNSLILIISNCTSPAWKSNDMYNNIKEWSNKSFCSIAQILPRYMWLLTTLGQGVQLNWKADKAYPLNKDLYSKKSSFYFANDENILKIPVVAFEPASFNAWGNVILKKQNYSISGFAFLEQNLTEQPIREQKISAEQRVENFLAQASITAKILAAYLANLPVSYEVARYIQEIELPDSNLLHLAEVFLGEIIERVEYEGKVSFDFYNGVRDKLKYQIPPDKAWELFIKISNILSKEFGSSLYMPAFFYNPKSTKSIKWSKEAIKFAELGIDILKRKGGYSYKKAQILEKEIKEIVKKQEAIIPNSKRLRAKNSFYNEGTVFNYDFEIAKYPVTFEEYDLFCEDTGRKKPYDEGWGRGKRPVINVSWYDAKVYCEWLSEKTGENYRLPTKAEWEFACRAGTTTKWSFGDDEKELEKYAWYSKNSNNKTHPVGEKLPNPWGLYDMYGNVFEWCKKEDKKKDTGIIVKISKEKEIECIKGGSWRGSFNVTFTDKFIRKNTIAEENYIGFRLLRTLSSDLDSSILVKSKEDDTFDIDKIKFNNFARYTGLKGNDNWYEWVVYVDESTDILDKIETVEYTLHSTFPKPIRRTSDKNSNFMIESSGWGEFEIKTKVYLKNGSQINGSYYLDFSKKWSNELFISKNRKDEEKLEYKKFSNKEIKFILEKLKEKNINFGIGFIAVGYNSISDTQIKSELCQNIGIYSLVYHMPDDSSQETIIQTIKMLNKNPNINGIWIEVPLPKYIDIDYILQAIDSKKVINKPFKTDIPQSLNEFQDFLVHWIRRKADENES